MFIETFFIVLFLILKVGISILILRMAELMSSLLFYILARIFLVSYYLSGQMQNCLTFAMLLNVYWVDWLKIRNQSIHKRSKCAQSSLY